MTDCGRHIRNHLLGLILGGILVLLPFAVEAENLTELSDPAFQQAVEKVVEQYILTHPEVIELTLQGLQAKRQAEERERTRQAIAARQTDLLNDTHSPVSGNPKGDVTVVEFFDYRCGYCKRVAGTVTQLQLDDPNVRVVYKDFPILGEASELASQAALASQAQGKHLVFHEALLASERELTRESLFTIASDVGINVEQLQKDMASPSIKTIIERNRVLARELGITGTPGFIVGTELVPGALELKDLQKLVNQVRHQKS